MSWQIKYAVPYQRRRDLLSNVHKLLSMKEIASIACLGVTFTLGLITTPISIHRVRRRNDRINFDAIIEAIMNRRYDARNISREQLWRSASRDLALFGLLHIDLLRDYYTIINSDALLCLSQMNAEYTEHLAAEQNAKTLPARSGRLQDEGNRSEWPMRLLSKARIMPCSDSFDSSSLRHLDKRTVMRSTTFPSMKPSRRHCLQAAL